MYTGNTGRSSVLDPFRRRNRTVIPFFDRQLANRWEFGFRVVPLH